MIESVLVAMDSSVYAKAALEQALDLAAVYGARITGLHVIDIRYLEMPPYLDYSYAFEAVPPVVIPMELVEQARAKSDRLLVDVREGASQRGVPVETRAEEGVPGQVIADSSAEYDLVVMGKRGEHAKWARDLLGSTAEAVVRRANVPVLLTEDRVHPLKNALVLYDGSEPARRALALAGDAGLRLGLELAILTVEEAADKGNQLLAQAASAVESLALSTAFYLRPGKTVKAVLGFLQEEKADIVFLGMRGHSPLRQLILGRTAEQLMRAVSLPVVLVP